MANSKQQEQTYSVVYNRFVTLANDLVSQGKLERIISKRSSYAEYRDPLTEYIFAGMNRPGILGSDVRRLEFLSRGQSYKLPKAPYQSHAEKFEDWFEAQHYQDIRFEDGYIHSNAHPELFETLKNTKQLSAAQKQIEKFQSQVNAYAALLAPLVDAGFIFDKQHGQTHLQHPTYNINVPIPPKPKDAIAAAQKAMRLYETGVEQKQSKKKQTKKLNDTKADDAIEKDLIEEEVPAINHNGQHCSEPNVVPEEPVAEKEKPVKSRGFALHNTPYSGPITEIHDDSRILVLDAGILHRCFGNIANDDKVSARFGQKVFDSLLNDAHFDAIIIPDYIADAELSGLKINNDNGHTEAKYFRDKSSQGGEYYSPRREALLQHSVRRHVDPSGEVQYLKDSEMSDQQVNPKIIVWETAYGKAKFNEYMNERKINPTLPWWERKKPGEGFGEMVIERLMEEPELKPCKKMVLSTDISYLRGDFLDLTASDTICRSNLGHYLHALIRTDLSDWSKICQVQHGESSAIKLDVAILNIREKMRDLFNAAIGNEPVADLLMPMQICDNRPLFKELTGLDPVDHMCGTHRGKVQQSRASLSGNLRT